MATTISAMLDALSRRRIARVAVRKPGIRAVSGEVAQTRRARASASTLLPWRAIALSRGVPLEAAKTLRTGHAGFGWHLPALDRRQGLPETIPVRRRWLFPSVIDHMGAPTRAPARRRRDSRACCAAWVRLVLVQTVGRNRLSSNAPISPMRGRF